MPLQASPIFAKQVFGNPSRSTASRESAVQGFSAIFGTILARQMLTAVTGPNQGPLGIQGGASGDIYGALFEQALGKILAKSPAMKPLNDLILREISEPGSAKGSADNSQANITAQASAGIDLVVGVQGALARDAYGAAANLIASGGGDSEASGNSMTSDSLGPVLLPPPPAASARIMLLPPPPQN